MDARQPIADHYVGSSGGDEPAGSADRTGECHDWQSPRQRAPQPCDFTITLRPGSGGNLRASRLAGARVMPWCQRTSGAPSGSAGWEYLGDGADSRSRDRNCRGSRFLRAQFGRDEDSRAEQVERQFESHLSALERIQSPSVSEARTLTYELVRACAEEGEPDAQLDRATVLGKLRRFLASLPTCEQPGR
jgi:hypothetical protein